MPRIVMDVNVLAAIRVDDRCRCSDSPDIPGWLGTRAKDSHLSDEQESPSRAFVIPQVQRRRDHAAVACLRVGIARTKAATVE